MIRSKTCNIILMLFLISGSASFIPVCRAQTYSDTGIDIIDTYVSDHEWSPDGRFLTYSRAGLSDGYYDVWIVSDDGSNRHCLTCSDTAPDGQNGGVTWHPSGEYLVFTAQNEDTDGDRADSLAKPGTGLNVNLWAITADGSRSWKLTDLETDMERPEGIIHPQFSHDGTTIVWAQAMGVYDITPGREWGEWALMYGDFTVVDGIPRIENIQEFQPGDFVSFYESHDFSPDDSHILFSGNLLPGQPLNGLDIYELEMETGALTQLTDTFSDWDEHAHYSPDGEYVYWMSGDELDVSFPSVRGQTWRSYVRTELWTMKSDGSNPKRLTYFNDETHADNAWFQEHIADTNRTVVSDNSVHPDGNRLAVTLAYEYTRGNGTSSIRSTLVILDLNAWDARSDTIDTR